MVKIFTGSSAGKAMNAEEARENARKRLPRIVFDYIDGAAGREKCLARNIAAFDRVRLQPRVLGDVENRSLRTRVIGREFDLPFGFAPMGMCGLAWPGADRIMAREAVKRNIPVCVSTVASISMERMRELARENAWFQLYVGHSAESGLRLAERAANAGYDTLVLTVDVPVLALRERDKKNGFKLPFRIGLNQFIDFATHPYWSVRTLVEGVPRTRNFDGVDIGDGFDRSGRRAGANWEFLEKLREIWKGKLVVKGVTFPEDAVRIQRAGADAIYVSNHGGRQLDAASAAILALPAVREAVGFDFPLMFDSGIRNGEDVVRALALGANFVFLGRPVLYSMGADGAAGLAEFVDGISEGISTTLAQIGAVDIAGAYGNALAEAQDTP